MVFFIHACTYEFVKASLLSFDHYLWYHEFYVAPDCLSLYLQMGTSAHEGIKVPFQLPPGQANECQFTFYVQSFLMPQKLRGTLTYMVKSEEGTSGEKVDFKVQLPCSAFICPVPCAQ